MRTSSKAWAVVLLLLGGSGCDGEPDGPGSAEVFVGRWKGSGRGERSSGPNGQTNWDINDVDATVWRVSGSAVGVESSALSQICAPVYDIDAAGEGRLRPQSGNQHCQFGHLGLIGEVLEMSIEGIENHLVYGEHWSVTLTLTRVP